MTTAADTTGLRGLTVAEIDAYERALAECDLHEYVRQAWHVAEPGVGFRDNWHIGAICEHLQAVSDRQIHKLIVNVPPRSMKSLSVAVFWPTWHWGPYGDPSHKWLFSSYALSLSIRDSIKCRRLLRHQWYQDRWPVGLVSDQNAKIRFENDNGGYRLSTSVDGGLMGEGGDTIVVDDAHNANEVESEAMRSAALDWWDYRMSTRLNDPVNGAFVVVMQRLHESDLTGHILAREHGWEHLCLPMEHEPEHPHAKATSIGFTDPRDQEGELLWPDRVGPDQISDYKSRLGSYGYAGQMQQRPSPSGGGMFRRDWFRYFDDRGDYYALHDGSFGRRVLKDHCWRIAVADMALTERERDNLSYTVVQVWDVERTVPRSEQEQDEPERGQAMLLLDQWRSRKEAPEVEDQLRRTHHRWKPDYIVLEDRHYGTAVIQRFVRDGLPVKSIKADRDKVARANMANVWMENGKVWFRNGAEYLDELEHELLMFPQGDNDDQVDALAHSATFANQHNLWREPERRPLPPGSYGAILGHDKVFNPRPRTSPFAMDNRN